LKPGNAKIYNNNNDNNNTLDHVSVINTTTTVIQCFTELASLTTSYMDLADIIRHELRVTALQKFCKHLSTKKYTKLQENTPTIGLSGGLKLDLIKN